MAGSRITVHGLVVTGPQTDTVSGLGVNVGDALCGCIIVKVLCCFIIIHASPYMSELNVNSVFVRTPRQLSLRTNTRYFHLVLYYFM